MICQLQPVEAYKGGENAVSGDSHIDFPCSHISDHDYDDGHVVQPKLKRKRSIRFRSKHVSENTEATSPKPRSLYGTQFPLKEGDALNVHSSDFVSNLTLLVIKKII